MTLKIAGKPVASALPSNAIAVICHVTGWLLLVIAFGNAVALVNGFSLFKYDNAIGATANSLRSLEHMIGAGIWFLAAILFWILGALFTICTRLEKNALDNRK